MNEWYGTEASTTWKEKFELDHPLCQAVVIMDAPVFSQGYKKNSNHEMYNQWSSCILRQILKERVDWYLVKF